MSVTVGELLNALASAGGNYLRASELLHTAVRGPIGLIPAAQLLQHAASHKICTPLVGEAVSALHPLEPEHLFAEIKPKDLLATMLQLAPVVHDSDYGYHVKRLGSRAVLHMPIDDLFSVLTSRSLVQLNRAVEGRLTSEPLRLSQLFLLYDAVRCGAHHFNRALLRCITAWKVKPISREELHLVARILRRSDGCDHMACLAELATRAISDARETLEPAVAQQHCFDLAFIAEHASTGYDAEFIASIAAACHQNNSSLHNIVGSHLFNSYAVKCLSRVVASPTQFRMLTGRRYGLFRALCVAACRPAFVPQCLLVTLMLQGVPNPYQFVTVLETLLQHSTTELSAELLVRCLSLMCQEQNGTSRSVSQLQFRGIACVVAALEQWGNPSVGKTMLHAEARTLCNTIFASSNADIVTRIHCIALKRLIEGTTDGECVSLFNHLLDESSDPEGDVFELSEYFFNQQHHSSLACARITLAWLQSELVPSSPGIPRRCNSTALLSLARAVAYKLHEEISAEVLNELMPALRHHLVPRVLMHIIQLSVASGECHAELFKPLCQFVVSQDFSKFHRIGHAILCAFNRPERQHRKDIVAPIVRRVLWENLRLDEHGIFEVPNIEVLDAALAVSSSADHSQIVALRRRFCELLRSTYSFTSFLQPREGTALLEHSLRTMLAFHVRNARSLGDLCQICIWLVRSDLAWSGLAAKMCDWIATVDEEEAMRITSKAAVRVASLLRKCEDDGCPLPDNFVCLFAESAVQNPRNASNGALLLHLCHCRAVPNRVLEEMLLNIFRSRDIAHDRKAFILWSCVSLRSRLISPMCVSACINQIAKVLLHLTVSLETVAFAISSASSSKEVATRVQQLDQICDAVAERIDTEPERIENRTLKLLCEAAEQLGPELAGELWERFHVSDIHLKECSNSDKENAFVEAVP